MNPSKQQRSLKILREVAERFGVSIEPKHEPSRIITEQEVIDAGILEPVQSNDWKITKIPEDLKIERVWEGNMVSPKPYITEFAPYNELDQLRWHAAVVTYDCGKFVTVDPAEMTSNGVPVPFVYSIRTASASIGAYSFAEAWSFLTGFGVAVEQVTGEGFRFPPKKEETDGPV